MSLPSGLIYKLFLYKSLYGKFKANPCWNYHKLTVYKIELYS